MEQGNSKLKKVPAGQIGTLVRQRRLDLELTMGELAAAAGVNKSTIQRIEDGQWAHPQPQTLLQLAEPLKLNPADLFAAAGYSTPNQLPTIRPYLRLKYADLPDSDIVAIENFIQDRYLSFGAGPNGPSDGEDEVLDHTN